MIATSRRPLSLYGEQIFPVAPLETPPGHATPAELGESPSVRLFAYRARAVQPDFALTPESTRYVGEICRRLDGLPLAIELASARIAGMPPVALLNRLNTRLPMLEARHRDVPERLQTMRSAIAWSYELLTPAEQVHFRRLTVFNSDFSLSLAVAISDPEVSDPRETAQFVDALADANLLRRMEWFEDEPTFGWLETIREFGLE